MPTNTSSRTAYICVQTHHAHSDPTNKAQSQTHPHIHVSVRIRTRAYMRTEYKTQNTRSDRPRAEDASAIGEHSTNIISSSIISSITFDLRALDGVLLSIQQNTPPPLIWDVRQPVQRLTPPRDKLSHSIIAKLPQYLTLPPRPRRPRHLLARSSTSILLPDVCGGWQA